MTSPVTCRGSYIRVLPPFTIHVLLSSYSLRAAWTFRTLRDETYSQTLERLLGAATRLGAPDPPIVTDVAVLVTTLGGTREAVASIYRRLGWSRQVFEHLVQTHRVQLATAGVRLHVATKDAASGRREQYITVDGMRYSALSRDVSIGRTTSDPEATG